MSHNTFPLPNLFIPGVQKAGTTALASFLSQHEDICLVDNKEAHVFDAPELLRTKDKKAFIEQAYMRKLGHYKGERYILDATPITMLHPTFVKECAGACPNAMHVVMLRDPVERAISHYAMSKKKGREELEPLAAFWSERQRMIGFYENLPTSEFKSEYRDHSYLIRGRYKRQLRTLYRFFPKNNVKVITQECLLNKHTETLEDIFDFLSLPQQTIKDERVFASNQSVHVPRWARMLMYFYFLVSDR